MTTLNDLLDRAAELYLQSSEAQHGDREQARREAELWWDLLREAENELAHEAEQGVS